MKLMLRDLQPIKENKIMAQIIQRKGELFKPELVKELISKVYKDVLFLLNSHQTSRFHIMEWSNLSSTLKEMQIVGEGEQKQVGKAKITSKVIKPLKFVFIKLVSQMSSNTLQKKNKCFLSVHIWTDSLRRSEAPLTLLLFMV